MYLLAVEERLLCLVYDWDLFEGMAIGILLLLLLLFKRRGRISSMKSLVAADFHSVLLPW